MNVRSERATFSVLMLIKFAYSAVERNAALRRSRVSQIVVQRVPEREDPLGQLVDAA